MLMKTWAHRGTMTVWRCWKSFLNYVAAVCESVSILLTFAAQRMRRGHS
jgi:hypothetical protein